MSQEENPMREKPMGAEKLWETKLAHLISVGCPPGMIRQLEYMFFTTWYDAYVDLVRWACTSSEDASMGVHLRDSINQVREKSEKLRAEIEAENQAVSQMLASIVSKLFPDSSQETSHPEPQSTDPLVIPTKHKRPIQ